MWFAHRVYAVTGRNKLIGVTLALAAAAQFCHGAFSIVWIGLAHVNLAVRVRIHRFLVQPFPEINLNPFKTCVYQMFNLRELIYYNLAVFFGKPSPAELLHHGSSDTSHIPHSPRRGIADLLVFSIILVTAKRSRGGRHTGVPNILYGIVRGSTQYSVLICFFHLTAQLLVFAAPVGDTVHSGAVILVVLTARALSVRSSTFNIQLLPAL